VPTQAKSAFGTILKISGTAIPELTNLTDVGGSVTVVDVTAHDGTSGYGSKIPTFIDGGTVRATFNAVLGNAQQIALRTAMENRTSGYGSKIPTFIDGGTVRATFNAVLGNAQQVAMRTAMENRTSTPFVAQFPTVGNPTATFSAFVTRWRIPGAPVGGALILETELTVDGAVVWA